MGSLTYMEMQFEFEDRLLTHLQVVIVQKFRKGESFVMSWGRAVSAGSGRSSIWMVPTLPILFDFAGSRVPSLNRDWLQRLIETADGSRGLIVVGEDGAVVQERVGPRSTRQHWAQMA